MPKFITDPIIAGTTLPRFPTAIKEGWPHKLIREWMEVHQYNRYYVLGRVRQEAVYQLTRERNPEKRMCLKVAIRLAERYLPADAHLARV